MGGHGVPFQFFGKDVFREMWGGTPWPPQFFGKDVFREMWGAATECRPNSSARTCFVRCGAATECRPYNHPSMCFIKCFTLVLLICALASAQEVKKPAGGSTIKGRVIYADTGQPLRRADVSLVTQDGDSWTEPTVSDRNGEFVFHGISAGNYFVLVNALDIVSPFSPTLAGDVPLKLQIALGQIDDGFSEVTVDGRNTATTEIRASRAGVITGRVLTESDEPIPKAQITVYQLKNGKLRLVNTKAHYLIEYQQTFETDSRGVYRIAGLATGEYIVRASESNEGGNPDDAADGSYTDGSLMVAFYPKAVRVQDATSIKVQQGSETKDVDIRFTERIGHRVSGTILLRGRPLSNIEVKLTRDEPDDSRDDPFEPSPARSDDKGQWEIRTVPDGKYTLSFSSYIYGANFSDDLRIVQVAPRRRELIVAGDDVTNLNVEMFEGAKVSGVVSVEGGGRMPATTAVKLKRYDPALKREAARDPEDSKRYNIADAKGEFEISQLPPGSYQFGFTIFGDYYVKSITLRGKDLLRNPVKVAAGQSLTGIKIVLSTDVVSLAGRLVDKNDKSKPLSNLAVLLLPVEAERRRITDPIVVFSDKDGRFAAKSAPGEYFVFVFDRRRKEGPYELPSETSLIRNASTLQKINVQRGDEKKVVEIVGP